MRIELKNITPPEEIRLTMEKQMTAERTRRAVVTTAEGDPCPVAETSLVCGNPTMHAWLLDTLRAA